MTFAEMKNIQKMNLSKFETYCLSRGYRFSETIDDDHNFGLCFSKGSGVNTKYLAFYEIYVVENKNVIVYQTSTSSEYLTIKAQIESSGLKLINSSAENGCMFKDYSDNYYTVNLVTGRSSNSNSDFFEITLKKKN